MIVRNALPGRKINLFDRKKHQNFFGVLFFRAPKNESSPMEDSKEDEEPKDSTPTSKKDPFYLKFSLWVDKQVFKLIKWVRNNIIDAKMMLLFLMESNPPISLPTPRASSDKQFEKKVKEAAKLVRGKIRFKQAKVKLFALKKFLKSRINFRSPSFSMEGIGRTYSRFRIGLALVLLVVSFFSLAGIVFPIVVATISAAGFIMPSIKSATPAPTPFRYDHYYQESINQYYPITEFRISIPKINLESNIVDNVDPKIEQEYKSKLQFGVAHAKGSYLPPENGPVYLFAHSTDTIENIARFNAKFFSVRELNNGDEIDVYFNGKKYRYTVKDKFIIDPEKVDVIQSSKANLILQTCWPPGTDWQRLIVLADKVKEGE